MTRKRNKKRQSTGNPLVDPSKFYIKDGKLVKVKPKKPKKK